MSNDGWTIAGLTITNILCAVLVPSLVATQGGLDIQESSIDALLSKNYKFNLNNYPGCAKGKIMVNSVCIDEPTVKTTDGPPCGIVPENTDLTDVSRYSFLDGSRSWKSATVDSNYPWSVYFGNNDCSGTIISDRWILSNANCHSKHMDNPLKFTTILENDKEVEKVHVPSESDRAGANMAIFGGGSRSFNINWEGFQGRKRRSADSHDLSLHNSKETIDFGTNQIVPACYNRPSMSIYTPHNVVLSGFFNQTIKTDIAHMLDSSDGALTVTPSVSKIGGDRAGSNLALWGSRGGTGGNNVLGRKRRAVANENFCKMDSSERALNLHLWQGRKRRSANSTVCFGKAGDAMLFRYPTDQFILGGMLSDEEDSNGLKYINVLDYANWIYQTSNVWSDVKIQPANQFPSSAWYDKSWKGDNIEMALADLSRSVMSLSKALPALNIIKENGLNELINMLMSAGDVAAVSGLSDASASNFNLDDMQICGMSDDGSRAGWNKAIFGRRRRSTEASCFGTTALGKFLELLNNPSGDGDRVWKMNLANFQNEGGRGGLFGTGLFQG